MFVRFSEVVLCIEVSVNGCSTVFSFRSRLGFLISFQTTEGKDVAKKRSFSSTFLDSERTLALILGLHAGHLARGVLVTTEELDKRKWIESELFCGGVESSAVLKEWYVSNSVILPVSESVH